MELLQCEQALQTQYDINNNQINNISKLTSSARPQNKAECITSMWGISEVKNFLINKTAYTPNQKTTTANTQYTTSTGSNNDRRNSTWYYVKTFWWYVIEWITIIVFIFLAFILIRRILESFYDILNAKRMVYLKVMLPRGEGKIDREQEKELAKDMKEKIWRMSQVFHNFHKLGELSTIDNLMRKIFRKPKITMILHYEDGLLSFLVGIYPEYQKIVESSISAQYPNCSIEITIKPKLFPRKYGDIMPLCPMKDQVYNIKTFKMQPDDPLNNVIDALGKISRYDTVSVIMPIKPVGKWFNNKAKKLLDRLYKNLDISPMAWRQYLLMPWKLLSFLVKGPTEYMISWKKKEESVTMVRMLKAKEDALNAMWEEAGLPFFEAGILIATSSENKKQADDNIDILVSAYNIYGDEYGNELDDLNNKHDMLGFLYLPLRKFAAHFNLPYFFFKKNMFWVNELASLFHFPDGIYNRSPAISWMQYKVLPCPDNLPILQDLNQYIISGQLAENYKKWSLSDILESDYKDHRAVGSKTIDVEYLQPVTDFKSTEIEDKELGPTKEIIEKDGKKFVKTIKPQKIYGYKTFKDGILLWTNIYRNVYSPVYMKREDRTRHHYCVGKSGTGKSVFLQTLARQDIRNGDGLCLIDPHGDLAEDMLAYVPKERAKDIIYFDAGNEDRPMGLNLYEINVLDEADRVVNDATEIFIKMFWPEIFGPRLQEYFKYWSLTLLEDFEDRPTLLDVVRLFTDETYREYKVKKVTNPTVKNRRDKTFNAMGDREKQEIIPYFSAKFVSFNTNRLIRNIIGQTKSAFKLEDVMDNRKILIINLSKGRTGESNAQLLGMILVSKIYTAAMARAKMEEKDRKDFYLYVDEFQNFVSWTFADILSEARKYRLCLIMAHQYIAQLEPAKGLGDQWGGKNDVKSAVFGNVGTMQSFKVGAPDAEFLEKEYAPVLSWQDIVGIANYKAYIKLNIDNSTSRVFSMNAIYTKDYQNKKIVPILKEYSAKKYGRKREFVDAEMSARLGQNAEEEKLPEVTAAPAA